MSGRHLKKLRIAYGYSQAQVASELHIDRTKVSRWENDIVIPDEEEIEEIARLFSTTVDTVKVIINEKSTDVPLRESESVIAEKIDELHLTVSNELNSAIANQEKSIRQQGEQIEMQKESLKQFSEQLQGEQRLKEKYRRELKQSQDNYDRRFRNAVRCFIITIIVLTLILFMFMFFINWANPQAEYTVSVPAIEVKKDD
ncbi:MAG: helix-turn-helix transcriptional regulator [Clostridiales bacterium]|nr:helix-turn-helix transcriptional regulator [Clostridiales bacterium]